MNDSRCYRRGLRFCSSFRIGCEMLVAALVLLCGHAQAEDAIKIDDLRRDDPVSFEKEILPILRKNCLACHSASEEQGSLVLESPQTMLTGGDTGAAIKPGDGAGSLLLQVASHQEEPVMPPAGNDVAARDLSSAELGLLKLWIDQGAKGTASLERLSPKSWQPLPRGVHPVQAIALSPDGQYVAFSRANQIELVHVPTGQTVTRLSDASLDTEHETGIAHRDLVQSLAFNRDGDLLASGGFREVKIWRRPRDVQKQKLDLATPGTCVAVSSDERWIAVGADNGQIQLFDATSGQKGPVLTGHTEKITSLKFSEDSQQLFSSSSDKTLRQWNVTDGTSIGVIQTPAPVNAIALAGIDPTLAKKDAGEQILISGDAQNSIGLWRLPAGNQQSLVSGTDPIIQSAISSDGTLAATLDATGMIRVTRTLASLKAEEREVVAWKPEVEVVSLAFVKVAAPADDVFGFDLVTGSPDGTIRLWSLPNHEILDLWSHGSASVDQLEGSPDGSVLVTGGGSGTLTLWDMTLGKPEKPPRAQQQLDTVQLVRRSDDGKRVASAIVRESQQTIVVFDTETRKELAAFTGHAKPIRAISFSAGNDKLVSSSDDKTIRVWDLKNPGAGQLHQIELPQVATSVGLNPAGDQLIAAFADQAILYGVDGNEIAKIAVGAAVLECGFQATSPFTIGKDRQVRFWNPADGAQQRAWALPAEPTALDLSVAAGRIAIASSDKKLHLLQLSDGAVQKTIDGAGEAITSLSLSANGSRLVTLSGNERWSVWNAVDGTHMESAGSDGAKAVVALDDNAINVVHGGQLLSKITLRHVHSLVGNTTAITDVAFRTDGRLVYATCADGSFRGFNITGGPATFTAQHGAAINRLAVASNGQVLATAGENATVRLWNAAGAGYGISQIANLGGPVKSVAFTRDSLQLVYSVSGENSATHIALLADGKIQESIPISQCQVVRCVSVESDDANATVPDSVLLTSAGQLASWKPSFIKVLKGHSQPVTSIVVSPIDSGQIYTGSADSTARHWDLARGAILRQFSHGGAVASVAVSPDGQRVATAGANSRARLYRSSGQQIAELRGDVRLKVLQARRAQELSASNTRAATAKRLFDEAEKDVPKKTEAEKNLKESLTKATTEMQTKQKAFDEALAKKTEVEKAAIDASTAAKTALLAKTQAERMAKDAGDSLKFAQTKLSQLQQTLATNPGNEALAELVARTQQEVTTLQQQSKQLTEALAGPNQKAKETTDAANAAAKKVTEAQKPYNDALAALKKAVAAEELLKVQHGLSASELKAAQDLVPQRKASLTAAEQAQKDAQQAVTDANTASQQSEKPLLSVAFSKDGNVLITGGEFENLHSWDGNTGKAIAALAGHEKSVHQAVFLNNDLVVSISSDNSCRTWELSPSWILEKTIGKVDQPELIPHRATAVDFSKDSTQLLVASGIPSRTGTLQVFQIADQQRTFHLPQAHNDVIYSAKFSPSADRIASGGADKYLRTFDVAKGSQLRRFEGHTDYVLGVSWKRDGETIASSSADKTIKLWEASTGDQRRTITQQLTKHVTAVAFVGESNTVVSSCGDRRVRIHNGANGAISRNFSNTDSWLHCVAVSADGKVVAGGDATGAVTLWNGTNGQLLHQLKLETE